MFWLDLCNLWRQPCFQCMQPLPNNIYSTIPSTYIALQTAWCVQWTLQLPVINGSGTFFPSLTRSLRSLQKRLLYACKFLKEPCQTLFCFSCSLVPQLFWHLSGPCRKKHFWLFILLWNWGSPTWVLGHPKKCMLFLEFNCNLRYFWKPHYFE